MRPATVVFVLDPAIRAARLSPMEAMRCFWLRQLATAELACAREWTDEYLVAWEEEYAGGSVGVAARRILANKTLREVFDIHGVVGFSRVPAVTGGASGWLAVWAQQRNPNDWEIRGRVVWEVFADGFEWGTTGSWSSRSP